MKCIKRRHTLMIILVVLFLSGCAGVTAHKETDPTVINLEEVIRQNPNDPDKRLELARLYLQKHLGTKQKYYWNRADEEAREALRLKPDFGRARAQLSWILMFKAVETLDEDLIAQSKREYEEALRSNPELIDSEEFDPPHNMVAGLYFAKAKKQKDKRYLDRSIKELKGAIRLKPNSAPAHQMLGGIYSIQEKYELAILELKEAIRLNPGNPQTHSALGEVYYYQDKNELALVELKEAVRLNPNDPGTHKMLGYIYGERVHSGVDNWSDEAIEKGIKEFKEVIRLNPKDDEAHRNLAYLYEHKGLFDLEIFEAKEALRLRKSSKNHRALGSAYGKKMDFNRALKEYQEALRVEPDYEYAHANVAFIYFLENRFKDAVQEYKKYYELVDSPNTYYILHYFLSLKKMGKDVEAQELLEDYIRDFKGEIWESHLLNFHQGNLMEEELISKAKNRNERCQAYCFVGLHYLRKGDMEKTREFFKKSLDTHAFCDTEYTISQTRFKQLEAE